jgi:hypothetical protein
MVELIDEADAEPPDAGAGDIGSAVQLRPATNTLPAVGASSSPAICSSDDLPAPDGPTSAVTSPGRMAKLTFLKISSSLLPWR